MAWIGLVASCLVASLVVHGVVRRLWLAIPLACLGGPLLFLVAVRLGGHTDALDGLVLFFGQLVAIPVAIAVGAGFRSVRS